MGKRFEYLVQLFAILILVVGCFLVLRPFLAATLLAAVICITSWPLYESLLNRFNGRKNWAALTMTFILAIVVILPLALVAYSLADNVTAAYEFIKHIIDKGPMEPPTWVAGLPVVGGALNDYWHLLANSHNEVAVLTKRVLEPAKDILMASGMMLGQGVMEMSLSVFICFFFYRDGVVLNNFLNVVMARTIGAHAENIVIIINKTVRNVMYGLLGSSLAQGVMAAIGFAVAGVPAALLLGVVTGIVSLIPIGPPFIWGGAVIWLFYQGDVGWAIFMLLWGVIMISGVDNMVLPLMLSWDSNLPFILLLLGVMGGVVAFGFVGIFLGPTLLAVGYSLLKKWANREILVEK
ncbi:MAG: AI-2E family transporter [Sideroxydans sp.]|jgi:predicted PurR-regulated permease PerM